MRKQEKKRNFSNKIAHKGKINEILPTKLTVALIIRVGGGRNRA